MGSLRGTIKRILKEEVPSEEWSKVADIMADIDLNNDEIESMFQRLGLSSFDLDKIAAFGSIDRIKAAGEFGFSFELSKPNPNIFGDKKEIIGKARYSKKSTNDTLILDFIPEGSDIVIQITFDRNTLVQDIPMSASARRKWNLTNDSVKLKNKKVLVAPGLVNDGVYGVKFTYIPEKTYIYVSKNGNKFDVVPTPDQSDVEKGLVRISPIGINRSWAIPQKRLKGTEKKVYKYVTNKGKEIYVSPIADQSDVKEGYVIVANIETNRKFGAKEERLEPTSNENLKAGKQEGTNRIRVENVSFLKEPMRGEKDTEGKIGKDPIPVIGKITNVTNENDAWTRKSVTKLITKGLSDGAMIVSRKPLKNPNEFVINLGGNLGFFTVKPKGNRDYSNIRNWKNVEVELGKKATGKDMATAQAKITLELD